MNFADLLNSTSPHSFCLVIQLACKLSQRHIFFRGNDSSNCCLDGGIAIMCMLFIGLSVAVSEFLLTETAANDGAACPRSADQALSCASAAQRHQERTFSFMGGSRQDGMLPRVYKDVSVKLLSGSEASCPPQVNVVVPCGPKSFVAAWSPAALFDFLGLLRTS